MIQGIISTLSLLWVLLVGTSTPAKSTVLNPKVTNEDKKAKTRAKINLWIQLNLGYIALAVILILLISFVLFVFWLVGVSTVESGTVYNHMNEII